MVQMRGFLTNSTSWTSHDSLVTIPTGYRPPSAVVCVQQGSGSNRFCINIYADGKVKAERYSNNTTMSNTVPTGSWLCIQATWIID